jgi:hypothetical protein
VLKSWIFTLVVLEAPVDVWTFHRGLDSIYFPPLYLLVIEYPGRQDISFVDPHHLDANPNSTYDPDADPD